MNATTKFPGFAKMPDEALASLILACRIGSPLPIRPGESRKEVQAEAMAELVRRGRPRFFHPSTHREINADTNAAMEAVTALIENDNEAMLDLLCGAACEHDDAAQRVEELVLSLLSDEAAEADPYTNTKWPEVVQFLRDLDGNSAKAE